MSRQEIETHTSLAERITQAAAEIVAMNTGLSLEDARYICDKAARIALQEINLRAMPSDTEWPDLRARYALVKRAQQLIGDELRRRGIPQTVADNTIHDLDTFYRGVRGIKD